jgi:DNA-binding transcriptional LysR family regulator
MELRHLRYFVAVAERQSFRLAAERIHVTQPAITRQIHDLEAELGTLLFERTSSGVKLTPAGELFLRETRTALDLIGAAARAVKRFGNGLQGSLRIGFVENATWDGLVPEILNRFEREAPDVTLELVPLNTPRQIAALADDRLDGSFVYRLDALPDTLAAIELTRVGVVAAVPRHWGFDERKPVSVRDLEGRPFVCFPRHTYPTYHDHLIGACREAGLVLNVVQEVTTETAILSLVCAGIGAAIVNAANRARPPALAQLLDLVDLPVTLPMALVYRQQNTSPALMRFLELSRRVAADAGSAASPMPEGHR